MDENKQKVNELTMRTLGSHYGGYTYVKVKKSSSRCKDRLEVVESYRRRRGGDRQREIPSIRNRVRS